MRKRTTAIAVMLVGYSLVLQACSVGMAASGHRQYDTSVAFPRSNRAAIVSGGKEKDGSGDQAGGSGPPTLGSAPGEGGGGLARGLEFIMYTEQVKRRVKKNWIVAEQKPGLSATVRFGIQPDGEVFAVELVKPSGDNAFDQSVVRAVKKANPLPPPPQTYQQEFATQKVEAIFGGEEQVKQAN